MNTDDMKMRIGSEANASTKPVGKQLSHLLGIGEHPEHELRPGAGELQKLRRNRRQRREELPARPHPGYLNLQDQHREPQLQRETAHDQPQVHGAELRRARAGDREKRDNPGYGPETWVDHVLQPQRSGPEQGREYR